VINKWIEARQAARFRKTLEKRKMEWLNGLVGDAGEPHATIRRKAGEEVEKMAKGRKGRI